MRGSKRALPGVAAVMLVLWAVSAPTPAAAKRGSSVALFFYAGHGIQVDGENYLTPVDADLRNKLDLRRGAGTFAAPTPTSTPRCRLRFNDEDAEWSGRCIDGLAFGRGRAAGSGWSYSGRASGGRPSGRGVLNWPTELVWKAILSTVN